MATDDDDGCDYDDDDLRVACSLGAPVPHVTPGRPCHIIMMIIIIIITIIIIRSHFGSRLKERR